jgi:hypothetical protein
MTSSTLLTAAPAGHSSTAVSASVQGLSPSTTYFYRLDDVAGGRTTSGSVRSFKTNVAPPPQQTPVSGTGAATRIRTNSAIVSGTVNPGGLSRVAYRFSYGTSAVSLNRATARMNHAGGNTATRVHAEIAGLRPYTTYFYRLDVTLAGVTRSGSVRSFKTWAPAPSVKTGSAKALGVSATISGRVDPNRFATQYHFELGTIRGRYTTGSASASAGSGRSAQPVGATLTGLRPHTAYHYRLVATSVGGTVIGADKTFKTGAAPPRPPRFSFKLQHSTLRDALAHGLRVAFACSSACQASASAFPVLAGTARAASLPVTVARGSASLRRKGAGVMTLQFTPAARRHLRGLKTGTLLVTGAAGNGGGGTIANVEIVMLRG